MTKEHSVCRALVHVSEMIITRQNQDTRSIYELMQFGVTGSGVCELGELVSQQAYGRIVHEVTPTQKNDRILLATLLDLSKYDCIVSMATAIDVEWFRNLGSPGSETEYEEGLDGCARGEIDWRRD